MPSRRAARTTEQPELQRYRHSQLSGLTNEVGVYSLADLDNVPLYIGKSTDGIRTRVQRHLTSARSDVIANRQLDVWEVGYVWAWPMPGASEAEIATVERYLIHFHHSKKALINGSIPTPPDSTPNIPKLQEIIVLPLAELESRRNPVLRMPRQADHFRSLISYILEVKDNDELRRTLAAHFERLSDYYNRFLNPDA